MRFESIQLNLRLVGCRYRCRHCSVNGRRDGFTMPLGTIRHVCEEVKSYTDSLGVMWLDELTCQPEWMAVLECLNRFGARTMFPTGGGAGLDDESLQKLSAIGIREFQIAFHGLSETHDEFVGRAGSYEETLDMIGRAAAKGFRFWIMVFVTPQILHDVPVLTRVLQDLGVRADDIGFTTYQYLGRAMDLAEKRFTRVGYDRIPPPVRPSPKHHSESEWLVVVKNDAAYEQPAFVIPGRQATIAVDDRLDVFYDFYTPSSFCRLPGACEGFRLGNLGRESMRTILERWETGRPEYLRLLENVSIRDLGGQVGVAGDIVYPHEDVIRYKWPYLYLKKMSERKT